LKFLALIGNELHLLIGGGVGLLIRLVRKASATAEAGRSHQANQN